MQGYQSNLIEPVGSAVAFINMNTFHTIELFGNIVFQEATSKKTQTYSTVLQATTSVKWPVSANTFVPVPYRWQNWLLAQTLGSFWSNLDGKMIHRHCAVTAGTLTLAKSFNQIVVKC